MKIETFAIPNNGSNTFPLPYDKETFIKLDDTLIIIRDFGTSNAHWTLRSLHTDGHYQPMTIAITAFMMDKPPMPSLYGVPEDDLLSPDGWFLLTETWGHGSIYVNETTFAFMIMNLLENV